jgi:spore germination protein GerM
MNRDPFDTLRSRNPAPPKSLPEAPMAEATRITHGHPSVRRGLAIAAAAAAVVLVAGGGWLIWSRTGGRQTVVGPTTTTTIAAAEDDQAPPPDWDRSALLVYFLKDGVLTPVMRDLRVLNANPLPDLGPLALELLLSGPGAWDAAPLPDPVAAAEAQLTTAIPDGTRVLSFNIADSVAVVDFSAEFAAAPPEALAQVVFTLTNGQQGAGAVHFLIEGEKQAVDPTTLTLLPEDGPGSVPEAWPEVDPTIFISVLGEGRIASPPLGAALHYPWDISGSVRGPVSQVQVTLSSLDGELLWQELVDITEADCITVGETCGGPQGWYHFTPQVPEAVTSHRGWAILTAVRIGPDGDGFLLSSHPIWLKPYDEADGPRDTGAATTTTMGTIDDAPTVVVYFLDADTGAAVPVARDLSVLNVRPLPDLGPLAVELLLSGPGAWSAAPLDEPVAAAEARLATAIPEGTELLSFDIAEGTATVDLSAEFLSGDPATLNARFAQLVFTLTRLEGVENVRVLVAGSAASPLAGEPGPLTWQDVDGLVPPAVIAYPPLGGTLYLPDIIVAGGFGRLTLTLIDGDGTQLWSASVVGGTDCCAAAEVPADLVDYGRWVTLQATGPEGGAAGAAFEMPIWLEPGPSPETTTTFGLGDLQPFPPDMSAGCAPDTVRDLAAFEDALAEGRRDLADLCALLGVPDWITGSGLWIPVYDLADGSRLYLGYAGPGADGLIYANLVSPDGTTRDLLGG